MVYARDLKSLAARLKGSSPFFPIEFKMNKQNKIIDPIDYVLLAMMLIIAFLTITGIKIHLK